MLQENELLPFAATPLLGERLLVLAPHPDDEALGCGGVVALNAAANRVISVVVATDGAGADNVAGNVDAYRARRERETIEGLAALGVDAPPRFLGLRDRGLAEDQSTLSGSIRDAIADSRPDLILVPSPVETHPDHVALATTFIRLVQSDESLRGLLAITRVAFYEVSQPIRPNTLVDISSVADRKRAAIAAHGSQDEVRDYGRFARGLNEYRTMSLPRDVVAAEAYWVISADTLRTMPVSRVCDELSPKYQERATVTREQFDATVVVRTKNRPALLREAVASIAAGTLVPKIVIVNDGGESPRAALGELVGHASIVELASSVGRSEAMNRGVAAASTPWIAFLDDDDIVYPEHFETLAAAAATGSSTAYYTDAVSVRLERRGDGSWIEQSREREYGQEFDADLLLVDNYIPLPTLVVRRTDYLHAGGFDRAFDLFEDWDFLIRLSRIGPFQRIPRITCEIRHFPSSGSLIVANPDGSPAFRDAKLAVWKKHRAILGNDVFANVLANRKRLLREEFGRALELEGLARLRENDTTRLEREKQMLIGEIGREHGLFEEERASREREAGRAAGLETEVRQLHQLVGELGGKMQSLEEALRRRSGECASLEGLLAEHRDAVGRQTATINDLYREIDRLNGVLDAMRRSKAWKLHEAIGRMTGRG